MSEIKHTPEEEQAKGELTPESLKGMSKSEIARSLKDFGAMSDEQITSLFSDPENITYNGEAGYHLSIYPGGRIELSQKTGIKDGTEIIIKKPNELAALVDENLFTSGHKEKPPSLTARLSRWARGTRLAAKRTSRLTLRGIRDGAKEGVDKVNEQLGKIPTPEDVAANVKREAGYAGDKIKDATVGAIGQKAAEVNRGVPLADRNVGLSQGLSGLDQTAAQAKAEAASHDVGLREGLSRLDATAAEVKNQPPTIKDRLKEATEFPWKISRLLKAGRTKVEMAAGDVENGIKEWWKKLPTFEGVKNSFMAKIGELTRGVPLTDRNVGLKSGLQSLDNTAENIKNPQATLWEKVSEKAGSIEAGAKGLFERIKKAFSWENKVQAMGNFKSETEKHLNIESTDDSKLDQYLLNYFKDFEGMDQAQIVQELTALLLNGKIGLSGKVEKYRQNFSEQGINLKEIGDYMEFSYEKGLRKENNMGKVWNAKIFRFLQTMSPLSVSLNAQGERVAGWKSMDTEQQTLAAKKGDLERQLKVLKDKMYADDSEQVMEVQEKLNVLNNAENNFKVKGLSKFYTKDGRTVGWYVGYTLGLLLPRGISRIARLSLAAGAYGVDFAGGLAKRQLQAEGLLDGDELTAEAAQKFSSKALHAIMRFSTNKVAGDSEWNGYIRGLAGGSMLSTIVDILGIDDAIQKGIDSLGSDTDVPEAPETPEIQPVPEPGDIDVEPEVDGVTPEPEAPEAPEAPETPEPEPVPEPGDIDTEPEVGEVTPEPEAPETPEPVAETPETTPEPEAPTETVPVEPGPEVVTEPETLTKTPEQAWWDVFRGETGSGAEANLKLMAERIINGQFDLGDSITNISPEAMADLQQSMQEAIDAYNQAGSMDALTPLQRLLLSASTGDADQVALAVLNNDLNAIEISRIGGAGSIDWAPAIQELQNLINQ